MGHLEHFEQAHHQLLVEVGVEGAEHLHVVGQQDGGKVVFFWHDEHLLQSLGLALLGVEAVEGDLALLGSQQAHDEVEQGALAGAVLAQ